MLEELSKRLRGAIDKLRGVAYVDEKALKAVIKEIQKGLILSDVNINLVINLSKRIEERVKHEKVPPGITLKDYVIGVIYEELVNIMGGTPPKINIKIKKPYVIMLVGIEGSGKTTSAGKLAYYFKNMGYKVGVFSTDTYRPAGREQLKQIANKIDVDFFDADERDSIALARKGLKHFDARVDVLIIDTAGRHKEEKGLLKEMQELANVIKPDLTLLVLDATIGQQAYNQAKAFHENAPVGGIFLTKLDGTARGGGALSAAAATGAKIYFIGVGENIEDIEAYDAASFVGRLLGIGDIKGILRKIEEMKLSEERIKKLKQMAKGKFTLIDMIEQFESVSKMGGLYKILSMIPGLGANIPKEAVKELEFKVKKWRAIINSMTDEEKLNPDIIRKTRLIRIARGSGARESEVRELIRQYKLLRKTLKSGKGRKLMKMLQKGQFRGI